MIGQVRDLLIGNCGRRVDNLVPKNIEEILLIFLLIIERKKFLILIELSCRCSLF